ncbi:hypothetical protein [Hymenobacter tenuis]
MKTKFSWLGGPSTSPDTTQTALRDLYRAARRLHFSEPYAPARLARIADQAEYFLQEWPAERWPAGLHSGHPLPAREELLQLVHETMRIKAVYEHTSAQRWSHTHWHQAITSLLAALEPFA